MSESRVVDVPDRARYEIRVDDRVAGRLTYDDRGSVRVLTHTVIRDEYEGQGLGSVLVRTVLDELRAAGRTIVPECTFVRDYLARHPEYADLIEREGGVAVGE